MRMKPGITHRSHGGETHERMKKALPRAAYIAFTGTPLLKDEKTSNKFGPIVHAYTMQRAVEDETVAPLLYEERVPELTINEEAVNRWFDKITAGLSDAQRADLKKKFAKKGAVYGAAGRIELIAWDIATHFSENIKALGLGLKGQVATDSKLDAIRYKKALDETGLVTSAIVISPPDTREGNAEVDEDTLPEVQKWWKQTVLASGLDAETYEKQVVGDFGTDDGPDLLIVVDKLLTGFDELCCLGSDRSRAFGAAVFGNRYRCEGRGGRELTQPAEHRGRNPQGPPAAAVWQPRPGQREAGSGASRPDHPHRP